MLLSVAIFTADAMNVRATVGRMPERLMRSLVT